MKTEMSLKFILLAFAWVSIPAFATGGGSSDDGSNTQDQSQGQDQYQGQDQGQDQSQSVTVNIGNEDGLGTNGATTLNDGDTSIDMSDNSQVENSSSNVVLVPNNNTENCLRVWGLSFGSSSGSGALGIPWRSKKCDYEQAADDAFAQGERELGWFWKCENSNLAKSFKEHDDPSAACLERMLGGMRATTTITTMTQTIETMEEEARSREALYRRRTAELQGKCSDEKNRMLEACMNTK